MTDLLVAILLFSLAQGASELVTRPDLSAFEPSVQTALEEAIASFESSLGRAGNDAERSAAWGELGMHYQAHHLQGLAGRCYREAARLDGGDFRWPYLGAYVALETGDLDTAEAGFRAAADLRPDDPLIRLRLAETALAAGDLDLARERYEALEGGVAIKAARHSGLGRVDSRTGRHQEAVRHLEAALELAPSASRLHHPLGMAHRQLGDREAAAEHLARRGKGQVPVPDPLLISVGERSRSAQFFLERGYAAARAGRNDLAVAAFRDAVAASPEDANAMLSLAQGLSLAGEHAEARAWLEKAVARDPDNALAWQRLGMARERDGDQAGALDAYGRALGLDPGRTQAAFLMGDALMRAGRHSEAAGVYATLPARDEGSALYRYREGLARAAAGDCDGSLVAFAAGLDRRPDNGELMQAWTRTVSSCAEATEADRARALEMAGQLFSARANREHAVTLAMALAANGRFEDAVRLQTQVVGRPLAGAADREALERYRAGQPALQPWPDGDAVFYPPRLEDDG